MNTQNTDTQATLSPSLASRIITAYADKASAMRARGLAVTAGVEAVGNVKALRLELLKSYPAHEVVSEVTLGYAAAAGAVLTMAGQVLKSVDAETWAAVILHARRAGAPAVKRATRDAVAPLADDVTPADRLGIVLAALESCETKVGNTSARKARPAAETGDADTDGAGPAEVATPVTDTQRASDAVAQSLRHALDLLERGATLSPAALDALVALGALAEQTVGIPVAA